MTGSASHLEQNRHADQVPDKLNADSKASTVILISSCDLLVGLSRLDVAVHEVTFEDANGEYSEEREH